MTDNDERRLRRIEAKVDGLLAIITTAIVIWIVETMGARFISQYGWPRDVAYGAAFIFGVVVLWWIRRSIDEDSN